MIPVFRLNEVLLLIHPGVFQRNGDIIYGKHNRTEVECSELQMFESQMQILIQLRIQIVTSSSNIYTLTSMRYQI